MTLYQLSNEQVRTLLGVFQNTSKARESGIVYEGRHYECIRADNSSIYARCVSIIACVILLYIIIYYNPFCL